MLRHNDHGCYDKHEDSFEKSFGDIFKFQKWIMGIILFLVCAITAAGLIGIVVGSYFLLTRFH